MLPSYLLWETPCQQLTAIDRKIHLREHFYVLLLFVSTTVFSENQSSVRNYSFCILRIKACLSYFLDWSLQIWARQDRVAHDDLKRQGVVEQKQPGRFQIRSMCPPVALPALSEL